MSDDRRYELRVTFKRNPPSMPDAPDGKLLARALRVIASDLEDRATLPNTLMDELFEYEHQYGYWNLRPVLEKESDCSQCREIGTGMGPSHDGSKGCESGSIASGGTRSHCTCDVCF